MVNRSSTFYLTKWLVGETGPEGRELGTWTILFSVPRRPLLSNQGPGSRPETGTVQTLFTLFRYRRPVQQVETMDTGLPK